MSALPGKPASNSVQSGQEQLLTVSPGERLQRARKDRNLEVSDMAERLNLSPGVVRALEADDYRMLPNATFVKGYLRSYARALDISGDDLVRAYEAITGCNQPEKVEPIAAPMISDTRKNQRNLLLALAVLVLAGAGFWFVSGVRENDTAATNVHETQPVVDDGSAGQQTLQDSAAPSVNPPVVVTRPVESAEDIMEAAQSMEEPLATEEPPLTEEAPGDLQQNALEDQEPAPQPSIPAVSPPASEPAAAPNAAAPTAGLERPASAAVASGTGLLNLRFQGECWVEVRDGSGRMVFSSLKRAGEEVTLRAATPIHVKLGNGDVVDVQYNHEPVAFATRPDRKVVRLSLGE